MSPYLGTFASAPSHRAKRGERAGVRGVFLAALALALAACGDTLYDATGFPTAGGGGDVCIEPNVVFCPDGTGVSRCQAQTPDLCGVACEVCQGAPTHGVRACVAGGPGGKGRCDFACDPGFLRCSTGCCTSSQVAAAGDSSFALLSDGGVRAWGANEAGQLGDGSTSDRTSPVAVAVPGTAIALGAGPTHSCAVVSGGSVYCWGVNVAGQVTGGTTSPAELTPVQVVGVSGATAVAAGADHTCAVANGGVTCWGSNQYNQLGPGPVTTPFTTPIASGATAVAAGRAHTCALVNGGVTCWGEGAQGQLGVVPAPAGGALARPIDADVVAVAAAGDHTCAGSGLRDLEVRCWGAVLGAGFGFQAPQPTPRVPVRPRDGQIVVNSAVDLVATGRTQVCFRRALLGLECIGPVNDLGQLGGPTPAEADTVALPPPFVTGPLALATGDDHGCGIAASGSLACWGSNARGQLGRGDTAQPATGTVVVPVAP